MANIDTNAEIGYTLKKEGNGVYAFVIEGEAIVANQQLQRRDGLTISNTNRFEVKATANAKILLMEVPMI